MKDIKIQDPVYLENYGINVKRYLTYSEIQAIVNGVKQFDTWAEREQNKHMLLLAFATDMTPEEIENIGADTLYCSGLIRDVIWSVTNYADIDIALSYTESISRSLAQIIKQLPKITEQLKAAKPDGGKKSK